VLLLAETPMVLLARTSLPADNLPEFISYGRANASSHLACALLNAEIGISVTHIPYRGAAPAMQDLIAGRINRPRATRPHRKTVTKLWQVRSRGPITSHITSHNTVILRALYARDLLL
jgi:tripartite-type tricarboxylate transporter receptor subunit TctC